MRKAGVLTFQPRFKRREITFSMSIQDVFTPSLAPVTEVLVLLTIILFWRDAVSLRVYFAISFLMYAAIVVLTLAYFVPYDLIIFTAPIPDHLEQIKAAATEWKHMNWLRSVLGLVGVLFSFKGLDAYYKTAGKKT
jgi:hypothetical protein